MRKVAFHNLGCKVNSYETEVMMQQLQGRGYELVPFREGADVYVINTCTVTNIADRKSRQMLHRAKKMNPEAVVVAVGCYVQADPEAVKADEAVDLIVGNDQKGQLADLIEARLELGRENDVLDLKAPREYEPLFLRGSEEHTRAFLKIQDGCNQFCSYCLIPYVRGRIRSRLPEDVVREAREMSERGFREIVLTGIHLSSYGLDRKPEAEHRRQPEEPGGQRTEGFGDAADRSPENRTADCDIMQADNIYGLELRRLIRQLAEIPGICRIRLGSLEPRIISREFLQDLKDCGKVCPHFHLSLQSGCDTVLQRMNRHYTTQEYREKCRLIREFFPRAAITTDVITGFPGETEEEFRMTRDYLEEIRFYEVHVFPYSRRKGTRADRLPGQLPESVKKERSRVLLEMTERHSEDFRRSCIGQETELLLEEEILRDGRACFTGFTREYVKLVVDRELLPAEAVVGDIFPVRVTESMLARIPSV